MHGLYGRTWADINLLCSAGLPLHLIKWDRVPAHKMRKPPFMECRFIVEGGSWVRDCILDILQEKIVSSECLLSHHVPSGFSIKKHAVRSEQHRHWHLLRALNVSCTRRMCNVFRCIWQDMGEGAGRSIKS